MSQLKRSLVYLLKEAAQSSSHSSKRLHQIRDHLDHLELPTQLQILHELLCVRSPVTRLPSDILDDLDDVLLRQQSQKVLTLADTIPPIAVLRRQPTTRLGLWRGDITTLTNVTAIVNAANGQGLGCFQPSHRCIDNVIHSKAGPRMRDECLEIMAERAADLSPGEAIVTKGYCLPAENVVHVVGPQLVPGAKPTPEEIKQLGDCYTSVLDAVEALPALHSGRKIVALCCISTGLFSFPARQAASIALDTVCTWLERNTNTSITDVIFNTFTEEDQAIYEDIFTSLPDTWAAQSPQDSKLPDVRCESINVAREWLASADTVLVSAGAGLSAATGLDYTSKSLFSRNFPAFKKHGLSTLYSVFGFDGWESEEDRWGYYFTHLTMVKNWPRSDMYDRLLSWLEKCGAKAHVRTSNADGLFLAHGWPAERLSIPQGSYAVLQCLDNCRPDATMPTEPFRHAAVPFLDPVSQQLTDSTKVPRCQFCGGKMFICVRAGSWFNELPFKRGEVGWRKFKTSMKENSKQVVILELGVGMSTPGVLRWPNEELALRSGDRVKIVRVGMGNEAGVSSDLEEAGVATSINGDIAVVINKLLA